MPARVLAAAAVGAEGELAGGGPGGEGQAGREGGAGEVAAVGDDEGLAGRGAGVEERDGRKDEARGREGEGRGSERAAAEGGGPVPPGLAVTAREAVFGPAVTGEKVMVTVHEPVVVRVLPVQASATENSEALAPPTLTASAPVVLMPVLPTVKTTGGLLVPVVVPGKVSATGVTVTAPGVMTSAARVSDAESVVPSLTVMLLARAPAPVVSTAMAMAMVQLRVGAMGLAGAVVQGDAEAGDGGEAGGEDAAGRVAVVGDLDSGRRRRSRRWVTAPKSSAGWLATSLATGTGPASASTGPSGGASGWAALSTALSVAMSTVTSAL